MCSDRGKTEWLLGRSARGDLNQTPRHLMNDPELGRGDRGPFPAPEPDLRALTGIEAVEEPLPPLVVEAGAADVPAGGRGVVEVGTRRAPGPSLWRRVPPICPPRRCIEGLAVELSGSHDLTIPELEHGHPYQTPESGYSARKAHV